MYLKNTHYFAVQVRYKEPGATKALILTPGTIVNLPQITRTADILDINKVVTSGKIRTSAVYSALT